MPSSTRTVLWAWMAAARRTPRGISPHHPQVSQRRACVEIDPVYSIFVVHTICIDPLSHVREPHSQLAQLVCTAVLIELPALVAFIPEAICQ